jgi:hypothetical protein
VALLFELTGKTSGVEESQVTEFVRSRTNGAVEYVPIARKFPVSCKFPTVIAPGMIASESMLPPPPPPPGPVTARSALEFTWPLNADASAMIVVVPAAIAVTIPVVLTVATEGVVELHVTVLVRFCFVVCAALPKVPYALNCAV